MEATVIIYEAPHRILKTIESIKKVFGNINLTILREITKIHEEALSMTTEEFIKHYSERSPKGEFVILWNTKEF
jgi:16S rRNA (cytidine1402-2'-O)-methyltransferase